MLRYFMMLTLMLMLVACGGDVSGNETDNTSSDSDEPVATVESQAAAEADDEEDSTEAEPFVLNVTGAETFDFEANPVFGCVEDEISVTTFSQAPKLDVYMKADITEGTYPLASFDANAGAGSVAEAVVVSVQGEAGNGTGRGNFYFTEPQGEFIIKEMPTEVGERFVATLTGTLQDNDGEEITVSANFDIETSGTYFMDCTI